MENHCTLFDLFEDGCLLNQQRTAVSMKKVDGSLSTRTYFEVVNLSNIVASVLTSLDCTNQCIGVLASPSIEIPAIILGILNVPACFAPVDPLANTALNTFIFRNLKINHVICKKSDCQIILEKWLDMECIDIPLLVPYEIVLLKRTSNEYNKKCDHSGLAYAMCTSGSTGKPKLVRVPHKCILLNIISLRSTLKVTHDDVVFMASPLTFDPSIIEIFLALSAGAALFMVPMTTKLMPRKLAEVLVENSVTILQTTPSLVLRFGPDLLKRTIMTKNSTLRALILGGEQCPMPSVLSTWREEGNTTEFWNIYGITEVSCWATLYKILEKDIRNLVNKSVPLGEPLLGTVLQVRDDRGQTLLSGKGQLYIGGKERVCLLSDEVDVIPGTMRATGDIVQFSPDGLLYVGRLDHQIKRHGQRINLSQVTEMVSSVPLIDSCCILQEPITNELVLFAVPNSSVIDKSLLYRELGNIVPKNCIPDEVYFLDQLPITRHGKVNAKKLLVHRKLARTKHNPGCLSDEKLRQLWKDILQIDDEINNESNFILVGGDSFQAIRLLNQIEQVIGWTIPDLLDFILHRKYYEVLELLQKNILNEHKFELESGTESETSIQNALYLYDGDNKSENLLNDDINRKRSMTATEDDEILSTRPKIINTVIDTEKEKSLSFSNNGKTEFSDEPNYHSISRGLQKISHVNEQNMLMRICKRRKQEAVIIKERWKHSTGKCIDASPLLVIDGENAVVYIGSHSHKFEAVSFETGLPLWTIVLGDRVESSACLSKCGKYVIVGSYDKNVYIVSTERGDIIWLWKTDGPVKSSPVIHPHTGIVFVGSHDQHVHALDIKSKKCVFSTYCGGGSVFSSPCVDVTMETIYVGTLNGILACIDCVSGNLKWINKIGKPIFSSPAVTKNGVIVGCVDNHLYHISSLNEILWTFKAGAPIFSSPCVSSRLSTNGLTVFGSHDSCIYCVHISTGQHIWTFETPTPVYSTPFIFQSDLIQCEDSSHEGGSCMGSSHEGGTCGGSSRVDSSSNGSRCKCSCQYFVVCCCTKGIIFILGLMTGKLLLSWELNGEIFSSPIVYNNSIIVGCRDDNIYNLQFIQMNDV